MATSYEPRGEQRQHLNISTTAYETLVNDKDIFEEKGGLSGIVNRILLNYMDETEASISQAVERKRQEYIQIIQNRGSENTATSDDEPAEMSPAVMKALGLLLSDYREKLINHYMNELPPREKQFNVRLQNDIYDILGPSVPLIDECYKTPGNYIRAVLEDYASKSVYQRERIYFREIYESIQSKLLIPTKDRPLITIRTRSASGILRDFRIKLVSLSAESDAPYHYLITLSRSTTDPDDIFKPATFRLSRIVKMRDTPSYGSGKITAKEFALLDGAIKQKSIPYLLDDTNDYAVELSPEGITMYKTILHLRPSADNSLTENLKTGGQILHFRCTYRQIENYFFQFGKDARILFPKEDAARFRDAYRSAFEAYN